MRSWLEEHNWRQGSFVKREDLARLRLLLPEYFGEDSNILLIVASQSCDVCASPDTEKFIEFIIARQIDTLNGNLMYNKHPRYLHIKALNNEGENVENIYLELRAHEKIKLSKDAIYQMIQAIAPDIDMALDAKTCQQFADWLAARYNRPALPTVFENRFNQQWQKRKREKDTEKLNEDILGIYVDIYPDKELEDNESYQVQLLFLISDFAEQDESLKKEIRELMKKYENTLLDAGCVVLASQMATEQKISVATFRNYRRFYLDSMSYKNETLQPLHYG
ncbi:hypothetical protein [Pelistega europaea]|uniref:Uncharacterized protein n=1 Tax=Pelistega europaea TaxID=106147 RepID=A0A7Y4P586_9BURK|nr:hypothetical protein [Pelistega europaea]NOL48599.1 hypothetical protein [Pelistega europaea]